MEDIKKGSWPECCAQRAFVEGAAWWQFTQNGSTMFADERDSAEDEAIKRYGEPITDLEEVGNLSDLLMLYDSAVAKIEILEKRIHELEEQ